MICRPAQWQFLTILFAISFTGLATAHAEADAADLEAVSPLVKIYGDTDEADHKPGLPTAEETLRVYWFWAPDCPCSQRAEPALLEFANRHEAVELIVVHSNANHTRKQAQKVAAERGFELPIYRDRNAELATAVDARMTPEVVVVDAEGIVYRGRPVHVGRRGTTSYIEEVVGHWRADRPQETSYRRPSGCPITRP